jgi:outer membrane protein assembly factor BamB
MARPRSRPLVIGIGSHAVALHPDTGEEIWRTKLKSTSYVTVTIEGDRVLAGAGGEVFCLDLQTGAVRWHNKLKGLGMGIVCFAGTDTAAQQAAIQAQRAAGAAAVAAS